MISARIQMNNPLGLHLRPVGVLCTEALNYECKIEIKKDNIVANAKSVLSVLAAGIRYGEEFELICSGSDEKAALDTLKKLFEDS
ncbi:HPr family phosphocarrier protein [Anaeromicropila populeti]|uniref:Phosphocarrier protein n=1 Tax=Anaeromicropila populeti TaxID=37658 RepID=A0A1I6HS19_9FIRM|nr:HPr family phosphocarrier protein [Anaeromicropila populeti]SFR57214.1 phosphocarrier protein [Anaeromicropila populeti]